MASVEAGPPAMGRAHLSYLPQRPPINLSFQDLTYTVSSGKNSKIILRSVSGNFRSGQLTAILGPSGAGKSTLLNILAGYRVNDATGQILTNGEPRNLKQFRKLSRYIMQEDLLQPLITVQEAMMMAADLKLGDTLNKEKKKIVVNEIIQLLRLSKAKNTVTEKLSGGERKRLSIGLELLNNPPVIFLDEPTTGLDDVASSTCVSLLKRVARGGRTVICSVHTPSARLFAEFDHVYVVAEGRCAYQGTSAGVVPFLNELMLPCPKTYNPADFVIEVSSGEYGSHVDKMVSAVENGRNQSWRDYGNDSVNRGFENMEIEQLNTGGVEKLNYKHGSTGCQQFTVLLKRMVLQTVRNKGYLWLRVGLHLFLGFIVSILFNKMGNDASKTINNFGFCFACVIAMLYTTMMPILLAFPSEVQLIKREYFNRWYGLRPYYAALVVSRTPATIFFSMIFLCITYPITAQPMELSRIIMFGTTCILVALISESMGTVISSTLSVVNSMFTGPVVTVPLMLLAVYGIGSGDEPPPLVWKLARSCSYMRYGLEGLVAAIYGAPRADLVCPDHVDYCEYKNAEYFIKLMGMSGVSFWVDFSVLICMLVAMNLAGYYLLRQRLKPNYAFRALKFIGKFVKSKMSHHNYLYLRVGMHFFLAAIVSVLFHNLGQDGSKTIYNFGYCFGCMIAMLYTNMMPILLDFPTEIKLIKREYFNQWYGLRPYYAASVTSRTPITILFSMIFITMTYYFTDQPLEIVRILMFGSTCLVVALISESMGLAISSTLNVVNAVFTGPAVTVPLMLLAVYGIGSGDEPPPIIWKVARACSFLRHGLEGVVASIYGGNPPRADLPCPDEVDFCELRNIKFFIVMLGMRGVTFWFPFGILVTMLIGMNMLCYYLLKQRLRPNMAFRALRYIGRFVKTKLNMSH